MQYIQEMFNDIDIAYVNVGEKCFLPLSILGSLAGVMQDRLTKAE